MKLKYRRYLSFMRKTQTNKTKLIMYSVQRKDNGVHIMHVDTIEEAQNFVKHYPECEYIPTNTSCIIVRYCEPSGPYSYGHAEESFRTYGGIIRCYINFIKWVNSIIRLFGPDYREIKDFFKYCHLEVNEEDRTTDFLNYIDKLITRKYLFI